MTRAICIFLFAFATSFSSFSQYDYRITGSFPIKHKVSIPASQLRTVKLKWGDVESECLEAPVEYGMWLSVSKLKTDRLKVKVTSLENQYSLVKPKFYLGRVESTNKGKRLTEVICRTFTEKASEYSFELLGLNPEIEYWMLVASDEPNKMFGVEVTEDFQPSEAPEVAESVSTGDRSVIGRITTIKGYGKSGVVVTLLDDKQEVLASTKSAENGTFSFKELPRDKTYLVQLEEDDTELSVDVFMKSGDGLIETRAFRNVDGNYHFKKPKNSFNAINLLTKPDWSINVSDGKTGIVGRVVDRAYLSIGKRSVNVGLYGPDRKMLASTQTDLNGRFVFRDLDKADYLVKIDGFSESDYSEMVIVDDLNVPFFYANSNMLGADGFFKFEKLPSEVVELKRLEEKDTRMLAPKNDFSQIETGKSVVLENILFEKGSNVLKSVSFKELELLAISLAQNPTWKIEISGHTDNQGSEDFNKTLSQNRAISVKNFLVSKGIEAERMTALGKGESKPIASNDTAEGREKNRRVEFVILKE